MTYKIGVIGDKGSTMPFKLFGFDVVFAQAANEIRSSLVNMAKGEYAVVFITEDAASHVMDVIEPLKEKMLPAVVLIPNHSGSQGIGLAEIQKNVEKAVGMNIL